MAEGTFFTPLVTHGIKFEEIYTDERVSLGTRAYDNKGNVYRFVKYGGTVTVDDNVTITANDVASLSGNAGVVHGISIVAGVANDYTFVGVQGDFNTNLKTATAAGELLGFVTDANGDMLETVAANIDGVRAVCLVTESGGLGLVRLM